MLSYIIKIRDFFINTFSHKMEKLNQLVTSLDGQIIHDTSKDKPMSSFVSVSNNVISITLQNGLVEEVGINGIDATTFLKIATDYAALV